MHKHQLDKAYDNVILHVVWDDDKPLLRNDGTIMPTLALKGKIDEALLKEYKRLVNSAFQIPCSKSFAKVNDLVKVSMIEQAAHQRLYAKAKTISELYSSLKGDWEETFYQVLAKNFGFKVNAEAFHSLSMVLPLKILRKASGDLLKTEAMLFGVAGLLEEKNTNEYQQALAKEFKYLNHKFELTEMKMHKAQWKFLRPRPANFPTLRLAQFAALLSRSQKMFNQVIELNDVNTLKNFFAIKLSSYWQTHYAFNKPSKSGTHNLGEGSIENIVINSVVPALVAYSVEKDDAEYFHRAVNILQALKPESNSITKQWQSLGLKLTNAFDAQGLIEQMNSFCKRRNCLNCSVGAAILKPIA